MTKMFTCAHLPPGLEKQWLQHLRDFDVAHPGCHFEVWADVPSASHSDIIEAMRVNPELSFTEYFQRLKQGMVRNVEIRSAEARHDEGDL